MIVLIPVFAVLAAVCILIALRLAPMFNGASHRLEQLLSDESLADRYRPMARLLREDDWRYLATQPGFTHSQIGSFRSQRRVVFRKYLNLLSGDFASVSLLIRALIAQSDVSRPDLAKALFHSQFAFGISLLKVEFSLASQAIGFTAVPMDVTRLLATLDEMSSQIRGSQMAAVPVVA